MADEGKQIAWDELYRAYISLSWVFMDLLWMFIGAALAALAIGVLCRVIYLVYQGIVEETPKLEYSPAFDSHNWRLFMSTYFMDIETATGNKIVINPRQISSIRQYQSYLGQDPTENTAITMQNGVEYVIAQHIAGVRQAIESHMRWSDNS